MEDEEDVREILSILLRLAGAQVTDAATVGEALGFCERESFDCIVTDLNLDRDGFDLLDAIRSRTGDRTPPAIALTGHVFPEDRSQAMAAGFHAYLTKPVDPQDLLRAVLEATGRASGA